MRRSILALVALVGCAPRTEVVDVADALTAMSGGDTLATEHWREQLAGYLERDDSTCLPSAFEALAPPRGPLLERTVVAAMPHYGFFYGPVHYRVGGRDGRWEVRLSIAVELTEAERIELPDCALRGRLADLTCAGTPYPDAPGRQACPDEGGSFTAAGSRANLRALLAHWSTAVEGYWNRDAARYQLPIHYDFDFVDAAASSPGTAPDLRVPLRPTCRRTPYFSGLRTGWSIPVLAHELGHYLGLLDEYEALSGISTLYPKTPFEGSEDSRMGLSMKRDTRLLPYHHYLVLRRYHCPAERPPRFDVLSPP